MNPASAADQLSQHTDAEIITVYDRTVKGAVLSYSPEDFQTLHSRPSIKHIEMDRKMSTTTERTKRESGKRNAQNNIERIGADQAGVSDHMLNSVNVAVLDTQIDEQHPYLKRSVATIVDKQTWSIPFTEGASLPSHGTHVAGTIGGEVDNGGRQFSVAPGVGIYGVTVMPPQKSAWMGDIISGLNWVADSSAHDDIHAVNMSLGMPSVFAFQSISFFGYAVSSVDEAGIPVVAAAGNASQNIDQFFSNSAPASFDETIAVSAINDRTDEFAEFSNFGEMVDVTAPGVNIRSTVNLDSGNRKMGFLSGTSMAAPHVTGVVALLQAVAKKQGRSPLTREGVLKILQETGEKPESGQWEGDPDGQTEPLIRVHQAIQNLSTNE